MQSIFLVAVFVIINLICTMAILSAFMRSGQLSRMEEESKKGKRNG